MSDKSDLKAELERKKQRLAQIREEKKRKEEERKKKEVRKKVSKFPPSSLILYVFLFCVRLTDFLSGCDTRTASMHVQKVGVLSMDQNVHAAACLNL